MPAKYRIIAGELEHRIRRNADCEKLPTEAALCEQFSCSRQTIRSALKLLEQKGLIVRRQGSGSYPALTASDSRLIAVLPADPEEYTAPALLRDIRKAAGEAGCSLLILPTGGSDAVLRSHLENLILRRPAGILMMPRCDAFGCFCEEQLAKLRQERIPIVTLKGKYSGIPCVRWDENAAAVELVSHLAARGHRKFAAILKADETCGIARFRCLMQAVEEEGADLLPENILWYTEQERLRLLEGDPGLLKRFLSDYRGDCSAVVCFNDEIGFRLLRFLRNELQDTAVYSYDDSYLAGSAALTSFGPARDTPGAAAVALLLQAIEGKELRDMVLPLKLRIRKSG